MTATGRRRMVIGPWMVRFGNIRKMRLKKPERGEWKGAPGRKAANEAVNTNKRAAVRKILLRVLEVVGFTPKIESLDHECMNGFEKV